jgi:hypothetical protein
VHLFIPSASLLYERVEGNNYTKDEKTLFLARSNAF